MASWVLIGFLNISWSHLHKLTFVHSLVLPPALKFYPPPDRNFWWRQIFHLDFSFSAFIFLTGRNFGFVNRLDFAFSENLSMLSRKYECVTEVYFFGNLSWWLKAQRLKLIWWKIDCPTFITPTFITSDIHHLRHSSPPTYFQTFITSDIHHLRRSSPQTFITSDVHHLRLSSPPT